MPCTRRRACARPSTTVNSPVRVTARVWVCLGITGDKLLPPEVYTEIKEHTLQTVRGTVQADILKEDQAQNTCIFSTDFALKMMGDIQQYFIAHKVRNYYASSSPDTTSPRPERIPITQIALTLANGFTYVEYYLSGHAHRSLRAESLLLLLQRHGRGVHGDRQGGAAYLGDRDARAVRSRTSGARSSSTTSRPAGAPSMRRRCSSTTSARPCRRCWPLRQLQLPAHQRLRRGDHHAHRGIVRRAMAIQMIIPASWAHEEREPPAGLVLHRGAHRTGGGGSA